MRGGEGGQNYSQDMGGKGEKIENTDYNT
jgi:hypothetical protein